VKNNCILCGSSKHSRIFEGTRDKKDIDVLKCEYCGLVFLSSFEHIIENFYKNSGMYENTKFSLADIIEESKKDDWRRYKMLEQKIINKSILDIGCGSGGFLKYSQLCTPYVAGVEIEERMISHLSHHSSINIYSSIEQIPSKEIYDFITMFHVLEHIQDPELFLSKIKCHMRENTKLIIEVPNVDDALISLYNNLSFKKHYFWSCHLILYNNITLKGVIEKSGNFKVEKTMQIQRYPLANHIYWILKGLPGGHNRNTIFNNKILKSCYEKCLVFLRKCDTIVAIVRRIK
jgi:2-polyprenyl-3-methyl-5-hydroxy-6-metoxy-1,4-benzoquinol methylase